MNTSKVKGYLEEINIFLRKITAYYRIKIARSGLDNKRISKPELFKPVDDEMEKAWVEKWSKLYSDVDSGYFRYYSNISGTPSLNYVPADVLYAIIERILNNCPKFFRVVYPRM